MKIDYQAGDHVECLDDTNVTDRVQRGNIYVCAEVDDLPWSIRCPTCREWHSLTVCMEGVPCYCPSKEHLACFCPKRFRLVYRPKESVIEAIKADIDMPTKAPDDGAPVKAPEKVTEPA